MIYYLTESKSKIILKIKYYQLTWWTKTSWYMVQHWPHVAIFWHCIYMRRTKRTNETNLNWSKRFHSIATIFLTHKHEHTSFFSQTTISHDITERSGGCVCQTPCAPACLSSSGFSWTWREGKGTFKYSSLYFETSMHEKKNQFHL